MGVVFYKNKKSDAGEGRKIRVVGGGYHTKTG